MGSIPESLPRDRSVPRRPAKMAFTNVDLLFIFVAPSRFSPQQLLLKGCQVCTLFFFSSESVSASSPGQAFLIEHSSSSIPQRVARRCLISLIPAKLAINSLVFKNQAFYVRPCSPHGTSPRIMKCFWPKRCLFSPFSEVFH